MTFNFQNINLGLSFQEVAEKNSSQKAVNFSTEFNLSYFELNSKANQTARFLKYKGIRKSDVIAISGLKSIETFVIIIACLKLGVIYSIFDNSSPINRIKKIFEKCKPKLVFVEESLLNELKQNYDTNYIDTNCDLFNEYIVRYENFNLEETKKLTGKDPAYIMFTSGSTGIPKGVLISHQSVLNFISWSLKTYKFNKNDNLTNVNPLYFDNSVFDIYSALFSGSSLIPFTKEEVSNPQTLINKVDKMKCTSWFSVPSLLIYLDIVKVLNVKNMIYINKIIFGGEGYPKPKLKKVFDIYENRINFYNVYGPTEGTCICSSYKISSSDFKSLEGFVPLGKLNENFSYLILDEHNKIVEGSNIGELCISGPNIALGYYNDFKRTKQVFVQNPYNKEFLEIIYKTGDLVRYDTKDKNLYFITRKDNQIKHMGYRIELDEIEHALSLNNDILESAVVHLSINEISQLVVFIVKKEQTDISLVEIKNNLKKYLPHYMIPNKGLFLEMLPKNANGKVDRKKLKNLYINN